MPIALRFSELSKYRAKRADLRGAVQGGCQHLQSERPLSRRQEFLSLDDLMSELRKQGVDDVRKIALQ